MPYRTALYPITIAASLVTLAACTAPDATATKPTPLVDVTTVSLDNRPLLQTLTGSVQAKAQTPAAFLVSGRLEMLDVDVGQRVSAGQIIARISSAEQQADVDAAQAGLTAAQSRLTQTKIALDRQEALWTQGLTTKSALESARTAWETASNSDESAKAQLALAQEALSYTALKAHADGVIIRKLANVDEVIQAGAPIIVIAEDGPRTALINVQEAAISGWDMNAPVTIAQLSNPSVTSQGRITEIAPALDATGTVPVKVEIGDPLPLGVPVSVQLQIANEDRIALPLQALTLDAGQAAVWIVAADNSVTLRDVTVERYETGVAIVSEGLEVGEKVVTAGGQFLSPGNVVEPREVVTP